MTVSRHKYFTIIHNPTAGRRRWQRLARILAALEREGGSIEVLTTNAPGHASDLAAHSIGKADVIVAAGGDGTLAEVVAGVVGSEQKLGLIPLGTANVVALDMGLAGLMGPKWGKVTRTLLHGRPRPLCVGRVTGPLSSRIFIMMVGVGFDGRAVEGIDADFKKRWGKLAYVLSGLDVWRDFKPSHLRLESGSGERLEGSWAILTNGRHYAGPYVLSHDADLFTPELHALMVNGGGRLALARDLLALGVGRLSSSGGVKTLIGQRFAIVSITGAEVAVQVDGDAFGTTPVEVEMLEDTVSFLAP